MTHSGATGWMLPITVDDESPRGVTRQCRWDEPVIRHVLPGRTTPSPIIPTKASGPPVYKPWQGCDVVHSHECALKNQRYLQTVSFYGRQRKDPDHILLHIQNVWADISHHQQSLHGRLLGDSAVGGWAREPGIIAREDDAAPNCMPPNPGGAGADAVIIFVIASLPPAASRRRKTHRS
jgi:hypothetical protein